jgi:probable F420-dependent oxidoreductase
MKFGFALPQLGPQATPENLIRTAQKAEQLGYDSLWVLERLLWPINPKDPYRASPDGRLPEAYQIVLDPLETLTFAAAHTKKIRLGTSVLVLPYHTPIDLARRIATLDILSGGRVTVGCGIGWSSDEFTAAGTPFEKRGARTDEFLQAMIALWTQDPVEFKGRFYEIPLSKVGPKPIQKPHPPLYVAGFPLQALKRAVRFGQGWNPSGVPSFEWLARKIQELQELARQAGRDPLDVLLRVSPVVTEEAQSEKRKPLVGSLAQIREDAQRLKEMGVTEILYAPPEMGWNNSPDLEPALACMEQLLEASR